MELLSSTHGQTLVVTVDCSRIDAAAAIQFKDQMRAITQSNPSRVVLDLQKVDFIDSSGLGAVVAVMKMVNQFGTMELAALSPTVAQLFKLTKLDGVFCIHPDANTALKAA